MTHVLIVGGGLIGLLTARALRRHGMAVTLLERGHTGHEASWAGGGILSPLHPWREPDAVTALAAASQAQWPRLAEQLCETTGVDPQYRAGGMLIIDDDDPAEVVAWGRRHGVGIEVLPAGELARLEPGAVAGAGHLFHLPAVASIRNPRLLRAVRRLAEAEGVDIREQAAVDGVRVEQGQVRGVALGGDTLAAEHVVICAGAWSAGLVRGCCRTPPPIRPLRGQMLCYQAEPGLLDHVLLAHGRYLIPRTDGAILAGSTVEDTGFACETTPAARDALAACARDLLPALAERPISAQWAGLRPVTPDGVPIIGPHPEIRGLWLNAGHFRNGIVTAPASADLLADLLAGAAPALDPAPFAWLES